MQWMSTMDQFNLFCLMYPFKKLNYMSVNHCLYNHESVGQGPNSEHKREYEPANLVSALCAMYVTYLLKHSPTHRCEYSGICSLLG